MKTLQYITIGLALICCQTVINAQPVLSYSKNAPVPGDEFISYWCDTTGISAGAGGANITWDFSGLIVRDSTIIKYKTAASTPGASIYNNTDVADSMKLRNTFGFTSIPFNYFYADTTHIEKTGSYQDSSVYYFYVDRHEMLRFPFTMNDSFTDTYGFTISYNQGPALWNGQTHVEADGYGTLKLPTGVYDNVLRIHRIDSMAMGGPLPVVSPRKTEEYIWYKTDERQAYPLLTLSKTENYWTGPQYELWAYKVEFTTIVPTAVKTVAQNNLQIAVNPNPNKGTFSIKLPTQITEQAQYTITDMLGSVLQSGTLASNGTNEITLDAAAGMYILTVSLPNGNMAKEKLLVQQ